MNFTTCLFRRRGSLNLLTASGVMRVLAACLVLSILWVAIYWASLLP